MGEFAQGAESCVDRGSGISRGDSGSRTRLLSKARKFPFRRRGSLGDIRRVVEPFPNWVLICHEVPKAQTKGCNVIQTLWTSRRNGLQRSLAASEGWSAPLDIPVPPSIGLSGAVSSRLAGTSGSPGPVTAPVTAGHGRHDAGGARLRDKIARGTTVEFSYEATHTVRIEAPLAGLQEAVAAIN